MIVVTGATGHLGRAVVDGLLARVPASRLVGSVRDPAKATALVERGVQVRAGDFGHPDELAAAFTGAEQVLVISVDRLGEEGRRLHRAAIEAARAAGARRVLYTSHMGTHAHSVFGDHFAAEAVLAEGGLPFTSLRNGFYGESALQLIGRGFETGEIRAPEDGPVSWTARADLAEAASIVLAREGRLDGVTPPLTAGEAFTMAELAAVASDLTGREIKRVTLTDTAYRDEKLAQGAPAPMVDLLLAMYRDARRGDFAATDPTLEALLGRRPLTMRDTLATLLGQGAT